MANASELALFALIVEAKSFNKAAKLADISPAALSKKISKLEKSLGVQLLYRTTRRLNLTEAGEVLYGHAKDINHQVNDAISAVSSFSEGLSGTIKMTVPTISGELLLAQAVAEFCQQHPKLTIEMRLENEFVDLIKEGQDLAIRTGVLIDSSLIAKSLMTSHWIVCCAPSYIEKYGKPETPQALTKHNCMAYTYQDKGAYDWYFSQTEQEFYVRISGNFATNNSQALRKAALAGYGIVYVPRCSVYEDLQDGGLVPLLTEFKGRELGVYAVYPYTKHQSQKIRLLIEHIKNAYQQQAEYF
jgi:DNA-binding transcriptional LysR family regulator